DGNGNRKLKFAGKVGSGFNARTRKVVRERLEKLAIAEPPFDPPPPKDYKGRWGGDLKNVGADHHLGLDPDDVLEIAAPTTLVVLRRRRVERRLGDGKLLQPLAHHLPGPGVEAGPDLAGELQLPVAVAI